MAVKSTRIYLLAVLLGVVFLAAQLHCCLELNSGTLNTHACPICSTTGTAIATSSPVVAMVPAVNRLEVSGVTVEIFIVVLRNIAPRAPPSL